MNPMRMLLKLDFICGGRGPFPGATAMVVVLELRKTIRVAKVRGVWEFT